MVAWTGVNKKVEFFFPSSPREMNSGGVSPSTGSCWSSWQGLLGPFFLPRDNDVMNDRPSLAVEYRRGVREWNNEVLFYFSFLFFGVSNLIWNILD